MRVLLGTNALILMAGFMLGPIYALYVEKIGGDLLDASFTFAAFGIAAGVTAMISGRYTDRIKETEYIVVAGYLIVAAGFFLYLIVDNVYTLLVVQIIIGLGEATYWPAFDALYSKHLDRKKFGSEWGAWEAMSYIVSGIAAIAGGLIVDRYGFNTLFMVMGSLALFSALYVWLLPRRDL